MTLLEYRPGKPKGRSIHTAHRESYKDGLRFLTGRAHGDFFYEGQPRGGCTAKERVTEIILYQAVTRTDEQVFGALGISDTGIRTPFEELSAAVEPVSAQKISVYDPVSGMPLGKTKLRVLYVDSGKRH